MIRRLASAAALALVLGTAASAQAPQPADATTTPLGATQSEAGSATPGAPAETTTTGSIPGSASEQPAAIPDSTEACIAAAAELGTEAETRTLTDDSIEQLDVLFSKMETLCDGHQFDAAMTVAEDIRSVLQTH
jgi:hypothetical protein